MSWYVFRRTAGGIPQLAAGPFKDRARAEDAAQRRQEKRAYRVTEHTVAELRWPSEAEAWFNNVRDTAEV